jgi:hypothetical protein
MTSAETKLVLNTETRARVLQSRNLVYPAAPISMYVQLKLITSILTPAGVLHTNPDHSFDIAEFQRIVEDEQPQSTITLPNTKAEAFVSVFKNLSPGHETDCYDFVSAVEDWGKDGRHNLNCSEAVLENDTAIRPGTPYAIIAKVGEGESRWRRTHSSEATDTGDLVSVLGKGSMLAILKPSTARVLYSAGSTAYISEAFSPQIANQYPGGLVPAEPSYEYILK